MAKSKKKKRSGQAPHRAGHFASHNAFFRRGISFLRRCFSWVRPCFQGKRAGVAVPDLVSGQAMLLTVVMTGGILFLVTSVAGILMFYQLQEMTDIGNSAAALFAADAALEKATYNYLKSSEFVYDPTKPCFATPPCTGPSLQLSNGASGSSYLIIPVPGTENATTTITAEGRGPGGRTIRLLQTTFLVTPSPVGP